MKQQPPKKFGQGKDEYNIHAFLEKYGEFAQMLEKYGMRVTKDGRLLVEDTPQEYCPPVPPTVPSKDHRLVLK
jgi:hypothetical protein